MHNSVIFTGLKSFWTHKISPNKKSAEHKNGDQPRHVKNHRKEQIEIPFEKFNVEQEISEISLNKDEAGAEEQKKETPKE